MAIRDGVDVGALALLRGAPLQPASRHETLAKTLVGAAIGALAFDAGMSDLAVLRICQAAVDGRDTHEIERYSSSIDEAQHQGLAIRLLRLAANELQKREVDVMEQCRVTLSRCRAAFSDAKVMDSVMELTQAIRSAS